MASIPNDNVLYRSLLELAGSQQGSNSLVREAGFTAMWIGFVNTGQLRGTIGTR
jgi:hypothetical protein